MNIVTFLKSRSGKSNNLIRKDEDEEDDVRAERKRVEKKEEDDDDDVIVIRNLTKVFGANSFCWRKCRRQDRTKVAVDNISVGIRRGEVGGLICHVPPKKFVSHFELLQEKNERSFV